MRLFPGQGTRILHAMGAWSKKKFLGAKNYKALLEENIAEILMTSYLAIVNWIQKA